MTDSTTVATLLLKRAAIERSIVKYEKALAQARVDLSHVNAVITIFDATGDRTEIAPYVDVHRILARGEAIMLCKQALADGPKNTRQLALYVIEAKGMDTNDRVLAKSVAARLIHALRQQWRRGKIERKAVERGLCVWGIAGS